MREDYLSGEPSQLNPAEKEIEKWQNIAQKAAVSGSESDARSALEKKGQAAQRLTTMSSEIERNEKLIKRYDKGKYIK